MSGEFLGHPIGSLKQSLASYMYKHFCQRFFGSGFGFLGDFGEAVRVVEMRPWSIEMSKRWWKRSIGEEEGEDMEHR